jgi:hypothetical protein
LFDRPKPTVGSSANGRRRRRIFNVLAIFWRQRRTAQDGSDSQKRPCKRQTDEAEGNLKVMGMNTSKDVNLQQHCCEHLISHTVSHFS